MQPSSLQPAGPLTINANASPLERYEAVRTFTEYLAEPLAPEDCVVQTMEDVSPTKWHLAHVSWFFETFLLKPHLEGYRALNDTYAYLFNSYYVQAGERHCRDRRGYLSRPTVKEVLDYRSYVDEHMARLISTASDEKAAEIAPLIEIGLNHEQQHQELLLTDVKHVFSVNPLRPAYREIAPKPGVSAPDLTWVPFDEGIHEVGHDGSGFAYDNEGPRHRTYLNAFQLANRPVTNAEYLQFMQDGGYRRPELWLSLGWATVQAKEWSEPFYWERHDDGWKVFTLAGLRPLDPDEPVAHLSLFEADAFARWAGARLPTEEEWEVAAAALPIQGNFVEDGAFHPVPTGTAAGEGKLLGMYGNLWEWTRSQYEPYPGYRPDAGALGEYNGKFMCNQFVLRGGSVATSRSHIRATYRNFFPPESTWQFMGVRLAQDG